MLSLRAGRSGLSCPKQAARATPCPTALRTQRTCGRMLHLAPNSLAKDQEGTGLLEQVNNHMKALSSRRWPLPRGAPLLVGLGLPLALLAHRVDVNPAAAFWGFYMLALETHPFTTKVCTGLVGALLGDLLAQVLPLVMARVKGNQQAVVDAWQYDYIRAGRFMLFSAVVGTPIAHLWFTFLDSMMPGTAVTTVASKVALDQLLMCPIQTSFFFMSMCALEGKAHTAIDTVRAKLVPTLKANYALWPAAHVVNFAFVPSDQRILYVNVVALIWTVFLSSMAAGSLPAEAQEIASADATSSAAAPMADTAATPATPAMADTATSERMVETVTAYNNKLD